MRTLENDDSFFNNVSNPKIGLGQYDFDISENDFKKK